MMSNSPSFKKGDLCFATDRVGDTYEAEVLEVQVSSQGVKYKVHFRGWSSRYDEIKDPANLHPMEASYASKASKGPRRVRKSRAGIVVSEDADGVSHEVKRILGYRRAIKNTGGVDEYLIEYTGSSAMRWEPEQSLNENLKKEAAGWKERTFSSSRHKICAKQDGQITGLPRQHGEGSHSVQAGGKIEKGSLVEVNDLPSVRPALEPSAGFAVRREKKKYSKGGVLCALDRRGGIYAATVEAVRKQRDGYYYFVHFVGFGKREDMWVAEKDTIPIVETFKPKINTRRKIARRSQAGHVKDGYYEIEGVLWWRRGRKGEDRFLVAYKGYSKLEWVQDRDLSSSVQKEAKDVRKSCCMEQAELSRLSRSLVKGTKIVQGSVAKANGSPNAPLASGSGKGANSARGATARGSSNSIDHNSKQFLADAGKCGCFSRTSKSKKDGSDKKRERSGEHHGGNEEGPPARKSKQRRKETDRYGLVSTRQDATQAQRPHTPASTLRSVPPNIAVGAAVSASTRRPELPFPSQSPVPEVAGSPGGPSKDHGNGSGGLSQEHLLSFRSTSPDDASPPDDGDIGDGDIGDSARGLGPERGRYRGRRDRPSSSSREVPSFRSASPSREEAEGASSPAPADRSAPAKVSRSAHPGAAAAVGARGAFGAWSAPFVTSRRKTKVYGREGRRLRQLRKSREMAPPPPRSQLQSQSSLSMEGPPSSALSPPSAGSPLPSQRSKDAVADTDAGGHALSFQSQSPARSRPVTQPSMATVEKRPATPRDKEGADSAASTAGGKDEEPPRRVTADADAGSVLAAAEEGTEDATHPSSSFEREGRKNETAPSSVTSTATGSAVRSTMLRSASEGTAATTNNDNT